MELSELRRHWERFGKDDPLWAVLTTSDKRYGRWDRKEFFYSGVVEVERIMEKLRTALDGRLPIAGQALDFGCGVGRVTQALCAYFDRVEGVDISDAMIQHAKRYNRFGKRCLYRANFAPDLRMFGDATFDFVYTAHVLQHMQPRYAHAYVSEFFRIVRSGGIVLFEIPTERIVGATEPLSAAAFRANIEIPRRPHRLPPGQSRVVRIQVTNLSDVTWPASGSSDGWFQVTVGNHWWRQERQVTIDDGRAELPHDVEPGQTCECELKITAPSTPGEYQLEVDLVQEGVAWFADRGSRSRSVSVVVGRPLLRRLVGLGRESPSVSTDTADNEPVMEMHGTPEETVRDWISAAGGLFVDSFDCDEISREPSKDWRRLYFIAMRDGA